MKEKYIGPAFALTNSFPDQIILFYSLAVTEKPSD